MDKSQPIVICQMICRKKAADHMQARSIAKDEEQATELTTGHAGELFSLFLSQTKQHTDGQALC